VGDTSKETTGILYTLEKRLVEFRLPRALAMKEKVDRGEVLDDRDLEHLEQLLADVGQIPAEVKKDPKFQDLAGRMMQLYKEITTKALENEKAKKGS